MHGYVYKTCILFINMNIIPVSENTSNTLDGKWEAWGSWSECSVTCGSHSGIHHRQRSCNGENSRSCFGPDSQVKQCTVLELCPNEKGTY